MVNIERLEKAILHIEQHPEQHDQGIWIGLHSDSIENGKGLGKVGSVDPWCGTTACLAGHVCFQAGDRPVVDHEPVLSAYEIWLNLEDEEDNTGAVVRGDYDANKSRYPEYVSDRAQGLLGFDKFEASWWFSPSRTVADFRRALDDLKAGRREFWRDIVYGSGRDGVS